MYFLSIGGLCCWLLILSPLLKNYGYEDYVWIFFSLVALATGISPILAGVLVDHKFSARSVISGLSLLTCLFVILNYFILKKEWAVQWLAVSFFLSSFFSAPILSLVGFLALKTLKVDKSKIGGMFVWGTIAWIIIGCLMSFVFKIDDDAKAFLLCALFYLLASIMAFRLPLDEKSSSSHLSLLDRLGGKGWAQLANPNVNGYLIALFCCSISLAAFFSYVPLQLTQMGLSNVAAKMTLAQVLEVVILLSFTKWLKMIRDWWLIFMGVTCVLLRYILFALVNGEPDLILMWVGVALHGLSFCFFIVVGQIYIEKRVLPTIRAQSQALLTQLSTGLSMLIGFFLCGWWYEKTVGQYGIEAWSQFWLLLIAPILIGWVIFVLGYKKGSKIKENNK